MNTKKILAAALAAAMTWSLCGCGGESESPAGSERPVSGSSKPYAGHTLYVANWQGYNSDADYCEKAFEDATGCSVEHVYFNSYEELMTTLMTGGNKTIDAVVLSNNYTQWFHEEGLIMNVDLTHGHSGQCVFMASGGDAGTAVPAHGDGGLPQAGLQAQGVGDDADVRAQANQLDGVVLSRGGKLGQFHGTKGGLVDDGCGLALAGLPDFGMDLPAPRAFDAMYDGKLLSLGGIQIVSSVGIAGIDHITVKRGDLFHHSGDNRLGFPGTKRAGNKIRLHIDNNQQFFHAVDPLLSLSVPYYSTVAVNCKE